jgi:hypothetical protein
MEVHVGSPVYCKNFPANNVQLTGRLSIWGKQPATCTSEGVSMATTTRKGNQSPSCGSTSKTSTVELMWTSILRSLAASRTASPDRYQKEYTSGGVDKKF